MNRRRLKRTLLIGIPVAFLLYTLIGFFGVPLLITKVILPKASEYLHGTVTVQKARTNPFVLSVALDGLNVADEAGTRLLACDHVYANAQVSSLWRGGPHLRLITLDRPFIDARLLQDGKVNLIELIKEQPAEPKEQPQEPADPWRLSFEKLQIQGGRVEFRDFTLPEPFEAVVEPLDIDFTDFDTDPANENDHRFTARLASGGELAWQGDFFLDPLSSEGRLTLSNLSLPHYRPYLEQFTDVRVAQGIAAVTLAYRFAPVKSPRLAEVTVERYELKDVKLVHGDKPLLDLPSAILDATKADAANRDLAVDSLTVRSARLYVTRDPDGTISLNKALATKSAPSPGVPASAGVSESLSPEPPPPTASPIARVVNATIDLVLDALNPWKVQVRQVLLEDAALEFEDLAALSPVKVVIDQTRLALGPVSSAEGYRVPLDLACRINEAGSFKMTGQVAAEDRTAQLDLTLADLGLPVLGPYMKATLPEATLASGRFGITGKADAALLENDNPSLKFTGELSLDDLRVDGPNPDMPLVGLKALDVLRIAFDHAARTVHVGEIAIDSPQASHTLVPAPEPGSESGVPASAGMSEQSEPAITYAATIDQIRLTSGELLLIDATVQPNGRIPLSQLDATIANAATTGDTIADVDVKGVLQGAAPFVAKGKLKPNPAAPFLDLIIEVDGLSMPPFSGYAGKYVGFTIDRGKLTTDNTVKLQNNQLDANVKVNLDAFYLGEKVQSPDAPNLPVKLALSLLRDRSEQINLDVPIKGDLSDPKVRVGPLIVQALVNVITKIATSPFDFIGGAFGGGQGEKLDTLAFDPGSGTLNEAAIKKLDVLATALRERPALSLRVKAGSDEAADGPALRKAVLTDQLRAQVAQTRPSDDPAHLDPSKLQLTDAEYRDAVARRFAAMSQGVTDPAQLAAVTAPPKEEPKPERRVVGRGRSRPTVPRGKPADLRDILTGDKKDDQPAQPPPPAPGVPASGGSAGMPAPIPFEQMEAAVLATVPLPDDALPQLARQRADAIIRYLTDAGAIEATRLSPAEDFGQTTEAKLDLQ